MFVSEIVTTLKALLFIQIIYSTFTQEKRKRKKRIYIHISTKKGKRKDLLTNIFTNVKVMIIPKIIIVFLCT